MKEKSFICEKCKAKVPNLAIGTKNRNHCPYCLWSLHVDKIVSGDRKSNCHGLMEPTGLVFKNEGVDKYGHQVQGETMLIHQCQKCQKITKNRLAGDDDSSAILTICPEKNKKEVQKQLFGVAYGS